MPFQDEKEFEQELRKINSECKNPNFEDTLGDEPPPFLVCFFNPLKTQPPGSMRLFDYAIDRCNKIQHKNKKYKLEYLWQQLNMDKRMTEGKSIREALISTLREFHQPEQPTTASRPPKKYKLLSKLFKVADPKEHKA